MSEVAEKESRVHKAVWGPVLWNTLHFLVGADGDEVYDPTEEVLIHTAILALLRALPCHECRGHASDYLLGHPFPTTRKRVEWQAWVSAFQASVHKTLAWSVQDIDTKILLHVDPPATAAPAPVSVVAPVVAPVPVPSTPAQMVRLIHPASYVTAAPMPRASTGMGTGGVPGGSAAALVGGCVANQQARTLGTVSMHPGIRSLSALQMRQRPDLEERQQRTGQPRMGGPGSVMVSSQPRGPGMMAGMGGLGVGAAAAAIPLHSEAIRRVGCGCRR
jgi:hypothetical protein